MRTLKISQTRAWVFICLLILSFGQAFANPAPKNINTEDQVPRVRLGFEDNRGFHRQLMLAFIEGTTDGVDFGYEGALIDDQLNDAFWTIEQGRYVIQAVEPIHDRFNAKIGADIKSGGKATFMIDALENIPDTFQVYLLDNLHGTEHNLREGNYQTAIGVGNFEDRFSLEILDASQTLSATDLQKNGFQVHYDLQTQKLWLINTSDVRIKKLMVYDLLGRMVSTRNDNLAQNTLEVSVKGPKGIYIAHIETEKGRLSKKFIVG